MKKIIYTIKKADLIDSINNLKKDNLKIEKKKKNGGGSYEKK